MSSGSSESSLATAKTIITTLSSVAATAMVVRTVVPELVPQELQDYLSFGVWRFLDRFSNQLTLVIEEYDGWSTNDVYEAAAMYLGPKITPSTRRLKVSKQLEDGDFSLAMEKGEEIEDTYDGVKMHWVWIAKKVDAKISAAFQHSLAGMSSALKSEMRSFELTFHRKNKDFVIGSYLPFIVNELRLKQVAKKTIEIHALDYEDASWIPTKLDHPATFDTVAMDAGMKDMILNDLKRFLERRDYYRKIGKAWKRGYLLYGPPGTGKSSLIGAIANFLKFDVYDLELTELRKNSDLKKLLLTTANKSVLVIEDIDCTIDFKDRSSKKHAPPADSDSEHEENKVTLSGFLNFIDGLWSSCGDERIIIFTTNHVEKLDPALLRPGRMDVHINLSYCTPYGFRILAANYLDIKEHFLFGEIEDLIASTQVTPAEIAEQLLKSDDVDVTLQGLVEFLHAKGEEMHEAKEEDI